MSFRPIQVTLAHAIAVPASRRLAVLIVVPAQGIVHLGFQTLLQIYLDRQKQAESASTLDL